MEKKELMKGNFHNLLQIIAQSTGFKEVQAKPILADPNNKQQL